MKLLYVLGLTLNKNRMGVKKCKKKFVKVSEVSEVIFGSLKILDLLYVIGGVLT